MRGIKSGGEPKRIASLRERMAVLELLNKVCRTNADGFAVYADGWSDAVVAEKLGNGLTDNNVMSVRREFFGPFGRPKKPVEPEEAGDLSSVLFRLAALEEKVAMLIADAAASKMPAKPQGSLI